jgi:hypothetical protein
MGFVLAHSISAEVAEQGNDSTTRLDKVAGEEEQKKNYLFLVLVIQQRVDTSQLWRDVCLPLPSALSKCAGCRRAGDQRTSAASARRVKWHVGINLTAVPVYNENHVFCFFFGVS